MRFSNRLHVLFFFVFLVAPMPRFTAFAQTTTAPAVHDEDEDLRKTVRELALRVSALEEELHRQRSATTESASLQPASYVVPRVDVRSSVESVTSSAVAEAAPVCDGAGCDYAKRTGAFDTADAVAGRSNAELFLRRLLYVRLQPTHWEGCVPAGV